MNDSNESADVLLLANIIGRHRKNTRRPQSLPTINELKVNKVLFDAEWTAQSRARGVASAINLHTAPLSAHLGNLSSQHAAAANLVGSHRNYDSRLFDKINLIAGSMEGQKPYTDKKHIWVDDNIAMICHVDFDECLVLAMQVKEITDAIGRGAIVPLTKLLAMADPDEAAKQVIQIKRAQVPPNFQMPPTCSRGQFLWIDTLIDYFLETMNSQLTYLHQYYEDVKPQLESEKEEIQDKRKEAVAVAIKFPFVQTSYLINWIVDNAHHPYLSPLAIEKLSVGSGLSKVQINNWVSNARKRCQHAIVNKEKKPGGFLDNAFLAASREKQSLAERPELKEQPNREKYDLTESCSEERIQIGGILGLDLSANTISRREGRTVRPTIIAAGADLRTLDGVLGLTARQPSFLLEKNRIGYTLKRNSNIIRPCTERKSCAVPPLWKAGLKRKASTGVIVSIESKRARYVAAVPHATEFDRTSRVPTIPPRLLSRAYRDVDLVGVLLNTCASEDCGPLTPDALSLDPRLSNEHASPERFANASIGAISKKLETRSKSGASKQDMFLNRGDIQWVKVASTCCRLPLSSTRNSQITNNGDYAPTLTSARTGRSDEICSPAANAYSHAFFGT